MDDKDCYGVIYKVTNRINNKIYIGQTSQGLESRKYDHENRAIHNSNNMTISKALNKYGFENFIWEIIEKCFSKEELDEMEYHYIISYKSNTKKFGYNNTLGGEGSYGFKHTKESCEKIRKLKTGVKLSDYSINLRSEKQSYMWKIIFPDGREENILNLSKFCRENLLNPGIMGLVSRGERQHHNGFKCIKLSMIDTKKCSDFTRITIKNAHIGKKLSEESIAKRTETQAGMWEIYYKDNNKFLIRNLRNYCKENNMHYHSMLRVSRGERSHHKGFKCRRLSHEEVYNLTNSGELN